MLKPKSPQASFYGSYFYDRIVPADHLLRKINQVVDFSFVNELVKDRYTPDFGKPAEDTDMGSWSYIYNDNGTLYTQEDAKDQVITFTYDAMNRLTGKSGTGLNVSYTYDSTTGGNYGKGKRTGMTDALGTTSYKYDARGRTIEEKRNVNSVDYTTGFSYDGADRLLTVTYPGGETATQGYNARGLPNTLTKGSAPTSLVSSALYNQLGAITQISLGNGLTTYYGYWGFSGTYDNPNGYYGRLYQIKTGTLQEVYYTWDAIGNLTQRSTTYPASETENFTYDVLDRLTAVTGAYSHSYVYNAIGNINSMNGTSYTYGDDNHKHAVTAVGSTSYAYDANGNMETRGSQTITWNIENQVTAITGGASFVYDGDGNRGKKTEGGEEILYINKYFEKNLTTSVVTLNYYLADKLIATKEGSTLRYVHKDSLTSTSVMSDTNGASLGSITYFPFGATRSGSVPTDKKFTGQRLDGTGLYYYNARYYDPTIGRFISADTFVQWSNGFDVVSSPLTVNIVPQGLGSILAPQGNYPAVTTEPTMNPQTLNRYSYVLNNPLRYTDPYGWWTLSFGFSAEIAIFESFIVSVNWGLVIDDNLNVGTISSPIGGGIAIGGEATAGVFIQTTDAPSIYDLNGVETHIGVDVPGGAIGPVPVVAGYDVVISKEYSGSQVYFGVGAAFDLHILDQYSEVTPLIDTNAFMPSDDSYYGDYYSNYDDYAGCESYSDNDCYF